MEVDSGQGPVPSGPSEPNFVVGAFGLVSRTFSLWARKLLSYTAISALAGIGFIAIQVAVFWAIFGISGLANVGNVSTDPFGVLTDFLLYGSAGASFVVTLILMLIGMVIYAVVGGAVTKLALDNYGSPNAGSAGASVGFAVHRMTTLIGAQLILGLVLSAIMTPALIILAVIPLDPYNPAFAQYAMTLLVVLLVSVIVLLYVSVRIRPFIGVVIAEDSSAVGSIRRAFSLTSRCFWHIFGGTLLLGISTAIVGLVISMILTPALIYSPILGFVVLAALSATVINPLDYVFQGVLYKDLSSRTSSQKQQQWW
ncbi:MAG: hypothetical protein C4K49_04210 [Candidatus Thorarchaeota archaeon]|nr:MAG: hypothetical protein C4K49_04210 [Candidatus Thorarchaeota archaeon]